MSDDQTQATSHRENIKSAFIPAERTVWQRAMLAWYGSVYSVFSSHQIKVVFECFWLKAKENLYDAGEVPCGSAVLSLFLIGRTFAS